MATADSRPPVLVTTKIPASAVLRLEESCDVELYQERPEMPAGELLQRVRGKRGLVSMFNNQIDRRVIDAAADLAVIATVAVGYNNIDVAAARERGIVVTNTPDVLTETTADLAWTLILDVTRRVTEGDRLVRRGGWKGWTFDFMLGADLRGKQLGIVGFGRIGRAVARRAAAFGMRVAVHAPRPPREIGTAEPMPLDRLLATSDVVTLHCPLTADTRHLIDQRALARMKRTAYLVNTSRGPVVDEAALAWALASRLIAGAALDVYESEPAVKAELLTLENVVLSPHLGSSTIETRTAMADLAVRNVIAVLSGQAPLTPVP
ncbi:MAG TPA: D-glycerate dehydrogenase [Vicinamibacterales bacterium]|nr:D-glycerate dehydrogenase [Vicinamibacterales bacterium]